MDAVDITRMSLDDVVILMSIPRRLVLTVRTRKSCCSKNLSCPALLTPTSPQPPPLPPAVQRAEDPARDGTMTRRGEHQRHWSTASVVDLTDNYAEADATRATVVHRPPAAASRSTRVAAVTADRWPAYSDLAAAEQRLADVHGVPAAPAVTRSWDRRPPAAAGETVSAGVGRRPPRYPVDYSSDTDAQFVDAHLPVEWRRPPSRPAPAQTTAAPSDAREVCWTGLLT